MKGTIRFRSKARSHIVLYALTIHTKKEIGLFFSLFTGFISDSGEILKRILGARVLYYSCYKIITSWIKSDLSTIDYNNVSNTKHALHIKL